MDTGDSYEKGTKAAQSDAQIVRGYQGKFFTTTQWVFARGHGPASRHFRRLCRRKWATMKRRHFHRLRRDGGSFLQWLDWCLQQCIPLAKAWGHRPQEMESGHRIKSRQIHDLFSGKTRRFRQDEEEGGRDRGQALRPHTALRPRAAPDPQPGRPGQVAASHLPWDLHTDPGPRRGLPCPRRRTMSPILCKALGPPPNSR